ncbi:hypothetical protein D9758_012816 [Tetrapyrgos nigripes]|uniref:Carrier domain-containing protein n=1 Tax=Tetrapyrgos nigripes TaxID=182062 RepID=A0A8H5CYK8_9AGAR|nr:hypothetical protein D9758_012816 [Tetrapyrgos nigripes]
MEPIPPLPNTQALKSTTFRPPPLDGSLSLAEIYDWHFKNSTHHPLYVYSPDGIKSRTISWGEGVAAMYRGTRLLQAIVRGRSSVNKTPVVAVLASYDAITTFTVVMSIMRADFICFNISPRNSAAAVSHLLKKVAVDHVLVSSDAGLQDLLTEALVLMSGENLTTPSTSRMPAFEELFQPNWEMEIFDDLPPVRRKHEDDIVLAVHSSGSTAFPKPIKWTNRRMIEMAIVPWFGERDLTGTIWCLSGVAPFHGLGLWQTCMVAACGYVLSVAEPRSPSTLASPETIVASAKATKCNYIFCVPSYIETWSKNPEHVDWLKTLDCLAFGGGPLNKAAGDWLISQGVPLINLYGSAEVASVNVFLPEKVRPEWEYFEFARNVTPKLVPFDENTYELVVVSNPFYRHFVLNTKIDGADAYAVGDLLEAHPTEDNVWRVVGRADDQIMHSNGEKTNPVPLESILNQDPHIQASVMFGRVRFQAGVIIEPVPALQFDPSDETQRDAFLQKIWPTVEAMNEFAPQHSRIFRETILIAKPTKPFQFTAKRTLRRQAVLSDYEEEIETLYSSMEASIQANAPLPSAWDSDSIGEFVSSVVLGVLNRSVNKSADLFEQGCDSLQAIWIKNSLSRALKQLGCTPPSNLVYAYPSINKLTAFFLEVLDNGATGYVDHTKNMKEMLKKYSDGFPLQVREQSNSSAFASSSRPTKTVLVTGTTGTLGCNILYDLLKDPGVRRVYALNRHNNRLWLDDRQRRAFVERGLDEDLLCASWSSGKLVMVEGDWTKEDFGLGAEGDRELFEEICGSVTHILCNAWRVDFNIGLDSFESSVQGVRRLIDLTASSSARLVFVSSIGVYHEAPPNHSLPEAPIPSSSPEIEMATTSGYTQAKWISEQLIATSGLGNRATVVRVGQVAGMTDSGYWNSTEWFPALLQASKAIGKLPQTSGLISWVPGDDAARVMNSITLASPDTVASQETEFVHLVHPRPVPWTSIAPVIAEQLGVPLVPLGNWVASLEHLRNQTPQPTQNSFSDRDKDVRALRILDFYRRMVSCEETRNREAFGNPAMAVHRGRHCETAFKSLRVLGAEDARKWVSAFPAEPCVNIADPVIVKTTAHTLCYTFALLALYPEEQEKLYRQIKSIIPDGRVPTYEEMPLFTQSMAVFYETLRMFPPVTGIPKYSAEDTVFNTVNHTGQPVSIPIPKDTKLIINTVGLHYNPRYWKDAEEFKPDRFLEDWPKDAFAPFSVGARACLGRRFFETEGIAILIMLVSKYKIEVKEERQFGRETFEERKSRLLQTKPGLTLTPVRMPLVFKRRN